MNTPTTAHEYFLRENVLTDNILIVAPKGYAFKGGYIAIVKEYTYQTAWTDKEQVKRFRSKDKVLEYIGKNYPKFECDDVFLDCLC